MARTVSSLNLLNPLGLPEGLNKILTPIDPLTQSLLPGLFGGGEQEQGAPQIDVPAAPTAPVAKKDQPDLTSFERPDAGTIPTFLGLNSSMSPQQQLSRIATLATAGSFGDIRTPTQGPYAGQGVSDVAKTYFKNLAIRSMTDEMGKPLSGSNVLPVYEQYLSQGLGQTPAEGRDPLSHFLSRLTRV